MIVFIFIFVCIQTWEVVQSPNSWPALNETSSNGVSSPAKEQSKKVLINEQF